MKTPLRWPVLVGVLCLLLACVTSGLPQVSAVPSSEPAQPPTPSIVTNNVSSASPVPGLATQPRGLTAVNNFEPAAQGGGLFDGSLFDDRTYTNPNIAGLTFRTSWQAVEPTQGNFVWTRLDTVFEAAEKMASGSSWF
jgi:hypothetical protein